MPAPFVFTRRQFMAAGAATAAVASAGPGFANTAWPTKPIKMLVGFAAGGQTDLFARTYGDYISRQVGQTVVVENKAGGGGAVSAVELKRSAPDGYTAMINNTTTYMTNPVTMKDIRYDVGKDFVIVSIMPTGSLPLIVSEKCGAKNLEEFIAYARKTEKVNIGTYAAGSYAHIAIAELNKQYGLKMEAVHYRGEAPMWTDLAGQTLDGGIGSYTAALGVLQTGRGRAIAVSRRRISVLPDVATFHEQGATSRAFGLTTFQACAVPAATPAEIVQKLSDLFVAAGKTDAIREMLKNQAIDEGPMTLEASQMLYRAEAPIWAELIAGLGLEPM